MCFSIMIPLKNIRRKFDLQGDEKSYQRHLLLDLLLCLLKKPHTAVYQFSHVFSCGYGAIQHCYFAFLMQRECVWKKPKLQEIPTFLVDGACALPLAVGGLMLSCVPAFLVWGFLGRFAGGTLQREPCRDAAAVGRGSKVSRNGHQFGGSQEKWSWEMDLACLKSVEARKLNAFHALRPTWHA